jgi:hypothetical protein
MALLIGTSRNDDASRREADSIPPLFVASLRDDLVEQIRSSLDHGDYDGAGALLRDARTAFPSDSAFPELHSRYLRLARRKAHFDTALQEALDELADDRFVASLGKFREAATLSRGMSALEKRVFDTAIAEADKLTARHWQVAETLLHEIAGSMVSFSIPETLWKNIEARKHAETIRMALDESGRAEHCEYLPHVRSRIAQLARAYPEEQGLKSRLQVLDGLVAQRSAEEREKNLRRLCLFRDRLDATENQQTLRRFETLASPFTAQSGGEPEFEAVLSDVRELVATYERASEFLAQNRPQPALEICDQVLTKRPANILFRALEEKAKSREWVIRLADATMKRARAYEHNAQYAEAMEEWEALRAIDPRYPGLDSEVLHCAALDERSQELRVPRFEAGETGLTPEIVEPQPEFVAFRSFTSPPRQSALPLGLRIAITEEAWNHLKTGLAATVALLLVVLVLASNARH